MLSPAIYKTSKYTTKFIAVAAQIMVTVTYLLVDMTCSLVWLHKAGDDRQILIG